MDCVDDVSRAVTFARLRSMNLRCLVPVDQRLGLVELSERASVRPSVVSRQSLCLLVVAGLVVASCSDDDGAAAQTTVAPTTEAPEPEVTDPDPGDELTGEGLQLGVLAPAPGLLTTLFEAQQRGIAFAAEDIAAGGGVLDGQLTTTTFTAPLGGSEAEVVQAAFDDGASALIGPAGSEAAAATRSVLDQSGGIACSASATVPGLTAEQDALGLFRTALPDDVMVSHVADTIIDRRDAEAPGTAWNVAIVARNDAYGLTFGNTLAVSLASRGLNPSVVDYNGNRVLFVGTASEVTDLDPDITVIVSYEEGIPILTELTRAGVDPGTVIGLDAFFRPRVATLAGPDGDPTAVDGFTMIGSVGDRSFLTRLFDADSNGQVANAAQAYDCAVILALATEAVDQGMSASMAGAVREVSEGGNTCTTYDDCLSKLDAGDDIDYDGASGNLAIDEIGDPTFGRFTSATISGGEVSDIESVDVDVAQIRREQAAHAAAVFTTSLQQALTFLGFFDGPIDGRESPELTAALAAFQASVGLPPTGVMDAATYAALRAALGEYQNLLASTTADVQRLLQSLGYYTGPIDGIWSAEVSAAMRAWQATLGVPQTGVLDEATVRAAYEQGVFGGGAAPSTTVPATTAPPTTAPPTTAPPTTAPPTTVPPTAPPTTSAPPAPTTTVPDNVPTANVFDTLKADPDFSIFVELALASGLTYDFTLIPFHTVFAPTNTAFEAALSPEEITSLKQDPKRLQQALLYHIVAGRYTASALPPAVLNLYGACLVVAGSPPAITVDGASVSRPDILATNGVIHGLASLMTVPEVPPTKC
jgi:peptidoglycan hydrolase-like protein with peptidoglycan-binding domain/ABC-type branched-subunit amino acid transport system substrate-binding protein